MAVYFAPIGSGIGDVIVCRPACDWLIANSGQPVYLVVRGPRQVGMSALIEGLAGEVREPDLITQLRADDSYYNLRDHPLQLNEDWFSRDFRVKYPNYTILDILTAICDDLGIKADFEEFRPLKFKFDAKAIGKTILIPGSTVRRKMLYTKVWIDLHNALKQHGVDSIVVGSLKYCDEVRALVNMGIPHIETSSIEQAVDLVSSASTVISVDTGLMHVAVQQGVKTIAVFGECELYFRSRDNCVPVFAADSIKNSASHQNTPAINRFSAQYDSWNWHHPDWDDGDYMSFKDVQKLVDLVLT